MIDLGNLLLTSQSPSLSSSATRALGTGIAVTGNMEPTAMPAASVYHVESLRPSCPIQRDVALFDPVWDLLLVPERFRILHLLLESVGYDGSTGELELSFYPLGIISLAAEPP